MVKSLHRHSIEDPGENECELCSDWFLAAQEWQRQWTPEVSCKGMSDMAILPGSMWK